MKDLQDLQEIEETPKKIYIRKDRGMVLELVQILLLLGLLVLLGKTTKEILVFQRIQPFFSYFTLVDLLKLQFAVEQLRSVLESEFHQIQA